MDEEGALEKLESGDDEEVVLAIRSFGEEALQACYQRDGNYSIMISTLLCSQGEVSVAGAPFHSNPSCSLKNSRKAGSSFNDDSSFVVCLDAPLAPTAELRRSVAFLERQIWARRPSSWRRPFLILMPS